MRSRLVPWLRSRTSRGADARLRRAKAAGRALAAIAVAIAAASVPAALGGMLSNGPLPPLPPVPDNPQTDPKILLGEQLYFDTRLSADSTISCATCHKPETGYAHHAPTDTGIKGQVGGRNSGTVINAAYMRFQFWDGRAGSLEEQALGPIHNPIEMGETLDNVVRKLNAIPGYREQFQGVFGTDVTTDGIAKAIAAFERTIVSGPAPFDRYMTGDKSAMSPAAVRGMHLFGGKGRCLACHSGPLFSDQSFHNLGVGMDQPNPDLGRENFTHNPADRGKFKTPMLRNIALTAPYLHDGSEKTLLEVVEFYDRGGTPNPNLDPLMRPLNLTRQEREDLVVFMDALSAAFPVAEPPPLPPGPEMVTTRQEGGSR